PGARSAGAAGCGSVSTVPAWMTSGSGPTARRLAAYRAGQPPRTANSAAMTDRVSPAATVWWAGACRPRRTRAVRAWMMSGSGPMARRLAAYRAGQPPRTANRAAMPDSVSPLRTTYFVVWLAAVTGD